MVSGKHDQWTADRITERQNPPANPFTSLERPKTQRKKHKSLYFQHLPINHFFIISNFTIITKSNQRFLYFPHDAYDLFRILSLIYIVLMGEGYKLRFRFGISKIPVLNNAFLPLIYIITWILGVLMTRSVRLLRGTHIFVPAC